jgi:uncharacterized protein YkwD
MDFVKLIRILILLAVGLHTAAASEMTQKVLAEVNLARTNPQGYAQLLAARMGPGCESDPTVAEAIRFLQKAHPLPALAPCSGLQQGAQLHVNSQGPVGGRGHGGWGDDPFTRMDRFGQRTGMAGENIYYGSRDARGIVCALIVDQGVADRGHRKNLFNRAYGQAGIAYGYHATYGSMCVIDFASGYVDRGGSLAGL